MSSTDPDIKPDVKPAEPKPKVVPAPFNPPKPKVDPTPKGGGYKIDA